MTTATVAQAKLSLGLTIAMVAEAKPSLGLTIAMVAEAKLSLGLTIATVAEAKLSLGLAIATVAKGQKRFQFEHWKDRNRAKLGEFVPFNRKRGPDGVSLKFADSDVPNESIDSVFVACIFLLHCHLLKMRAASILLLFSL